MCGIVGYIGNRAAAPILLKGLHQLEYRGYDSAGVALGCKDKNDIMLFKAKGKVSNLESKINSSHLTSIPTVGIGHTRWATHGEPSEINAHPHASMSGDIVLVHNGIIENYKELKEQSIKRGYRFESHTDTEVLVNLIDFYFQKSDRNLIKAVKLSLNLVVGAYAIVVMERSNYSHLVAASKSSPLVIGLSDDNSE